MWMESRKKHSVHKTLKSKCCRSNCECDRSCGSRRACVCVRYNLLEKNERKYKTRINYQFLVCAAFWYKFPVASRKILFLLILSLYCVLGVIGTQMWMALAIFLCSFVFFSGRKRWLSKYLISNFNHHRHTYYEMSSCSLSLIISSDYCSFW